MENCKQEKHIVLVHGAFCGAWTWYKLKALLESAGHKVTAFDLSASGINMRNLHELTSFHDYSKPLLEFMDTVPSDEKVVLVGHSFGGLCLGLAMEEYPEKISVSVFLTALVNDTDHQLTYPIDQYFAKYPADVFGDAVFSTYEGPEGPESSVALGPQVMATKMFQNCSAEEIGLAKMLVRPTSLFLQSLTKAKKFTAERFGSVKRAFILCNEDGIFPIEFQRWFVENIGVAEVREIKGADHFAMLSKPEEVCKSLIDITNKLSQ